MDAIRGPLPASATWAMSASPGRRYGSVCGRVPTVQRRVLRARVDMTAGRTGRCVHTARSTWVASRSRTTVTAQLGDSRKDRSVIAGRGVSLVPEASTYGANVSAHRRHGLDTSSWTPKADRTG